MTDLSCINYSTHKWRIINRSKNFELDEYDLKQWENRFKVDYSKYYFLTVKCKKCNINNLIKINIGKL